MSPRQINFYNKVFGDGQYDVWKWINWAKQYERQRKALDTINVRFVNRYPYIYFKYTNRPVLIAYSDDPSDWPPREEDKNIPLWHYNDFIIKTAVGFVYTKAKKQDIYVNGQDSKKFWGWGSLNPQPYNAECMSVMPGHTNHPVDIHTILRDEESSGSYYINSWKRIIESEPNIVIICDWNNWTAETAIEGCIGPEGWKDYYGNDQYDWYLQITQAYSNIFKHRIIPPDTYIRDENNARIYLWDGKKAILQNKLPQNKPVIILPHNWGSLNL